MREKVHPSTLSCAYAICTYILYILDSAHAPRAGGTDTLSHIYRHPKTESPPKTPLRVVSIDVSTPTLSSRCAPRLVS